MLLGPARITGLVAVAAGAAGLLLGAALLGGGIEDRLGEYLLFHLRGVLPSPPEVVVVAEDRASAEALGIPSATRRWPRSLHARAIEKLTAHGASVIAFDLLFNTPDPAEDDALARALRRAGCVVLIQGLERRLEGAGLSIEIDQPIDPIPKLGEAAAAIARFPLPKVPARVDRFWTFHGITEAPTVPSVVLQLAARDLASRWVELLATEPQLPNFDTKDWTGRGVTIAMQKVHAVLRAKPDVVDRVRARLQSEPWSAADKHRLATLIALYAGDDSRYLNFRGPAGTIRTISYATLLSGSSDTTIGDLSGKVVFVGVSELRSATQPDSYDTVYSGLNGININGAEIAATAFADLDEDLSPRRPVAAGVAEIVVVALVLGAAASFARVIMTLAAGTVTAAAVIGVGWYSFVTERWLLPIVDPILFQVPIGILTAAWYMRVEEHRKRQHMAGAARQYLPEEVVRSLASGPLRGSCDLAGDVRYAVCLASDIEGFTTLSERLPPDTVQRLLNQYFHGMFEVIQRHGGVISDIVGDGVMSVWSAPADALAACIGAVAASVDLLEAVEKFNLAHPDSKLPTRIGLHAGSALVGVVGGAGRYAFSIVGDVANTASRIEGLNKQLGTRLLASEQVLSQVTGFVLRPLGEFLLAGKSDPVRISEVLGRIGDFNAAMLASRFAEALEAFQAQCWNEAIAILETILRAHPEDGPSRYFLAQALRLRVTSGRTAGWPIPRVGKM